MTAHLQVVAAASLDASCGSGPAFGGEGNPSCATAMRSYWPEALGAAAALLLAALLVNVQLCADVTWQLWIGHHLRQGARFAVDIMEVNPPLWFWMAIPVDWLSGMTGIRPNTMMVATIGFVTAASLVMTGRIIAWSIPDNRHRTLLLMYAAALIFLMPLADIGQREQYALIAVLPYVALIATRFVARTVAWPLAVAVGVGAGMGFALKHYFLVTPILLELMLLLSLRSTWRAFRPETLAIAGVGSAYAAAVLIYTPDYLTSVVPLIRLAYDSFSAWDIPQPTQISWLLTLCLMMPAARILVRKKAPFSSSLLVAAIGFGIAWAIQHKGWPYQAIATSGCLHLALAALLAERMNALPPISKFASPVILALPLALGVVAGPYVDQYAHSTRQIAAGLKPGQSLAFVSPDPSLAWPMTANRQFRYPTRYYGVWMLNAIMIAERGDHDPRFADLGRRIAAQAAADYRCAMPDRIAFVRPIALSNAEPFDVLSFFSRDPAFAAMMRHYRPWRQIDDFNVYVLATPWRLPPATACRRGV